MKNLFYSESESILFLIVGYTDNENKVDDIVKMLKAGAKKLAKFVPGEREKIETVFVTKSSRYENMRVFYLKTENIPKEEAILLPGSWTMNKWLYN